jgi:TolB-like protein/Tfp pilus assembly protein PilF
VSDAAVMRLLKELRRRRVFRVAGLYVVGVWLLMQAANMLFPAWGIPDAAMRFLLWAGLLGFPVALVFGWVFDISTEGIRRTQPVGSEEELLRSMPLRRSDYVILTAFVVVVGAIVYDTTGRVMQTATVTGVEEWRPSAAEIEPHSVAVLPFSDLSPERDQEYFTDGISEEILNRLAAFRELKVIARTSSFAFKDSGFDIGRISGLLAVNYLLQGSVRRDGQQLRISAQLVDRAGVQVWSETFDRELQAIFSLQDEIAEAVATSIVPQIVPPEAAQRLPDLDAYNAYLVGREIVARRASGWMARALVNFDRAIELDPQFAELYAERAIALVVSAQWVPDATAEFERAQRDIDTALALKPGLARAYAAQALLLRGQRPGSDAEQEALLRRALAADPNHVDAMNWLAWVLSRQGREDEADEIMQRALRLDPVAPVINANWARRQAQQGRWAEAERRLLRMLELPQFFMASIVLVDLYHQAGRLVDATEVQKRILLEVIAERGRAPNMMHLITIYAMLGLVEQAEDWRERSIRNFPGLLMMRLWELDALSLRSGARDYAMTLGEFETIIRDMGPDLADIPRDAVNLYGPLRALAGDAEGTIRVLAPLLAEGESHPLRPLSRALAWAYLQAGDPAAAAALLEPLDRDFREREAAGRLHLSDDLAYFALNTLLLGDPEQALELLARAAEAGWRGYYAALRDPRWDAVRERPEFQAIMIRVKADLDLQRAKLEAIDAEDDFIARYEAALALHGDKVDEAEP